MEPGVSMPHSQGLFYNPYPVPNQPIVLIHILRSILTLTSHLRLGLPKGIFPVGLPVKMLKALLPSSILATCPVHLNVVDLIRFVDLQPTFLTLFYFSQEWYVRRQLTWKTQNTKITAFAIILLLSCLPFLVQDFPFIYSICSNTAQERYTYESKFYLYLLFNLK